MRGFLIVFPLVALMLTGAILRRAGFLRESDVHCMAKLVYWMISPAILFRAALRLEMDWASQLNYAAAIFGSAIMIAVGVYLFGRFVLKNAGGLVLPVSVLSSFRSNSIMVGIPVVMLALGDSGIVPIAIYFAVSEAGYNLLSIMGAELSRGSGKSFGDMIVKTIKNVAVNPMFLASVGGLTISSFGFHALPGPVDTIFTLVANMATGLSLLMIGASLRLSSIRNNVRVLLPDCAVRLLIHPALLYLCFLLFPAAPEIIQSAIIMTAAPAANISFAFAQGLGLDSDYAAGLIGITTLGFVVTMPLWLNFLGAA